MTRRGHAKDATMLRCQEAWLDCCASPDVHRFDCPVVPREARSRGPFLPVASPTVRELVAAIAVGGRR